MIYKIVNPFLLFIKIW